MAAVEGYPSHKCVGLRLVSSVALDPPLAGSMEQVAVLEKPVWQETWSSL